jgi:hypothetical protein
MAGKFDKDNAAGQSRGNGSMLDLAGWKSSGLKHFTTAALLREAAKRTVALEGPKA